MMKKMMVSFAMMGIAATANAQTQQYDPVPYNPGALPPVTAHAPYNWGGRFISNAIDTRFGVGPGLDANGLHDQNADAMWLIGSFPEGPFPGTWYCADLGKVNLLAAIKLWNYNEEGNSQRGIRDVDIYVAGEGAPRPDNNAAAPFYDTNAGWSLHASHTFESADGYNDYPGCDPVEFKPV